jgi:hypothetical protein
MDALMTSISQSDETREYTVAGHVSVAASALQDEAVRDAVADAGYRVV